MSPDEVLRHLRRIRFSPKAGRPVSLSWIARQANYQPRSLMHAVADGRITRLMAQRLTPVIARLVLEQGGDIAATLGPLGGGSAGLGRPGPRRPEEAPPPRRRPPG